mmetsp:Transcript_37547/g.92020  ORF Transcript_37547/g.92020 Transcript_37547/m.92020 type:complete len:421 (-) Transcript_37547:167-1429(-)
MQARRAVRAPRGHWRHGAQRGRRRLGGRQLLRRFSHHATRRPAALRVGGKRAQRVAPRHAAHRARVQRAVRRGHHRRVQLHGRRRQRLRHRLGERRPLPQRAARQARRRPAVVPARAGPLLLPHRALAVAARLAAPRPRRRAARRGDEQRRHGRVLPHAALQRPLVAPALPGLALQPRALVRARGARPLRPAVRQERAELHQRRQPHAHRPRVRLRRAQRRAVSARVRRIVPLPGRLEAVVDVPLHRDRQGARVVGRRQHVSSASLHLVHQHGLVLVAAGEIRLAPSAVRLDVDGVGAVSHHHLGAHATQQRALAGRQVPAMRLCDQLRVVRRDHIAVGDLQRQARTACEAHLPNCTHVWASVLARAVLVAFLRFAYSYCNRMLYAGAQRWPVVATALLGAPQKGTTRRRRRRTRHQRVR